ncbi:MAG: tripartite tricarboxylate transporter substrate binding protein [Burkholderiaceae bacterium]|nr:tripartite tricarboxylate transporter substrate binding protein [Burkholderiaceae bacterium]
MQAFQHFIRGATAALAFVTLALSGTPVAAQDKYPDRPIRLILGFPTGGPTDISARIVAGQMEKALGQPVIVENKPGAGSNIGTEAAARSKPDGYTLFIGTIANTTNMSLYKNLSYNIERDFIPITQFMSSPSILVVNPALPIHNLQELIAYAKANPGKLTYASSGAGGSPHMAGEMLRLRTGIDILHVPYKGAAPALTDVIGGTVSMGFKTANGTLPSIESGKLRAIAVAGKERMPQLPNVPTLIELGIPDFEVSSWNGLFAPAGTPQAIIDRLAGVTIPALQSPGIRKQFIDLGSVPVGSTPAEFKQYVHNEVVKWAAVAKAANVTID